MKRKRINSQFTEFIGFPAPENLPKTVPTPDPLAPSIFPDENPAEDPMQEPMDNPPVIIPNPEEFYVSLKAPIT